VHPQGAIAIMERKGKNGVFTKVITKNTIVIDVLPLIAERGIVNGNKFLREAGLSANQAHYLMKRKVGSVNSSILTQLCIAFKCLPNDLFSRYEMDVNGNEFLEELRVME
jgi:DNA-binding Xre family transcriptional regulator